MRLLCQLAKQKEQLASLVEAGAVSPIVLELGDGRDEAKLDALLALRDLSGAIGGERATVDAGGIRPLVSLIKEGGASTEPHAVAALSLIHI